MFRRNALLLVLVTVAGLLAAGLGASPASAQSNDVQVDPNSPAGTQYDIPVRRARREAQSDDSSNQDDPSLFGEGVTPDGGSSSGDDSSGGDSDASGGAKSDDSKSADKDAAGDDEGDDQQQDAATVPAAGDSDSGGQTLLATQAKQETSGPGLLLAVLGIALALVAAATISGWLIRRRS